MRRLVSLVVLVILAFLTTGIDCNGEQPEPSKDKKFELFSFAIITDLHIGREIHDSGAQDYGAKGFADYNLETGQANEDPETKKPNEGGFNFRTDRLVAVVDWLNTNYKKGNIKFLVVLGDIADSAEMSEFFRAKKILDNLEIPYIPLIGNHDVWSHVGELSNNPWEKSKDEIGCRHIIETAGQEYFEKVFWSNFHNKRNINLTKELFGNSWQRQEEMAGFGGSPYLQNYAFSYQRIHFIALDYDERESNCRASFAYSFKETNKWLKQNLEKNRGEIVFVLSHHPYVEIGGFTSSEVDTFVKTVFRNENQALNFGGHIHAFPGMNVNETFTAHLEPPVVPGQPWGPPRMPGIPVIITKGMTEEDADFLRIVRVKGPKIEDIDYNNGPLKSIDSAGIVKIEIERPILTPTPVLKAIPTPTVITCPPEGEPKFTQGQSVVTTDSLKVRENPGISFPEIKTQPKGTSGKILEGPVCADNYVWWKVEHKDGTIGWSAEDWLEVRVVSIRTPTPIPKLITPTPIFKPTPTPTPASPPVIAIKGKIAFVSDRDGNAEIYLMTDNTTNQINLTNHPANDWDPAWSPDGQKIAFVSDRDGNPEIYVMNIDESNLRRLTFNDTGDINPAWFPDGSAIIFAHQIPRGWPYPPQDRLYIMNADGANQREFPIDPAIVQEDYALRKYSNNEPAVSPDGSKIIFTVESWWAGHLPVLYLMNSDGANVIRFGDNIPHCSSRADWSPDGKRIVFSCQRQEVSPYAWITGIYLINNNGSGYQEISPDGGFPAWSPGGDWIAFVKGEVSHLKGWENLQIYLTRPDGSEVKRITFNEYNDWDPDWSQ